ncbi:MAG: hypothetical protein NTV05_01675 [Acidobacteria bacterium]|nr:hypothetical protein [Acidobacteriota bacterium]
MSTATMTASSSVKEIRGVYKYCDDWCEYCRVTARCASHRVKREWEARRGAAAPMDRKDLIAFTREVAAADGDTTRGLDAVLAGDAKREYQPILADEEMVRTANQFAVGAAFLLTRTGWRPPASGVLGRPPCPQEVLAWYHVFLAARAGHALVAAARADRGILGELEDAQGSAKIALISIDRSRAALEKLAGVSHGKICRHLIQMLNTLAAGLEARIPGAREFVRIGLDAPVV